jgi:fido (protein-threonine AMPylation protein)
MCSYCRSIEKSKIYFCRSKEALHLTMGNYETLIRSACTAGYVAQTTNWIRESNLIEGIDDPREDERCERAWKELQRKKWNQETILWLHKRIMWVLNRKIAGQYRYCNVQVGSHVAVNWDEVPGQMMAWIWNAKYAHERGEEEIKKYHVEFERIHPFVDGNGRTGRMIMNWQRKKGGLELLNIKASDLITINGLRPHNGWQLSCVGRKLE